MNVFLLINEHKLPYIVAPTLQSRQKIKSEIIAEIQKDLEVLPIHDLTTELITAIQTGSWDTLLRKYQLAQALLVEEFQYIAGKDSTQAAFCEILAHRIGKNLPTFIISQREMESMRSRGLSESLLAIMLPCVSEIRVPTP